jgi:hypothetical protein
MLAKRERGVEGGEQAVEGRLARAAEPAFVVEVVDRDEVAPTRAVDDDPVVAPAADRRIVHGRDLDSPAVA